MVKKDTMLRFWCQKVLPLVYDDSLSYYELLNKVVLHLNQHTEDINALIDFYDTFAEDVEEIIRQMIDDGDFNEIVADTIGSMIAAEYDPEQQYIIFDYCIYNSKLYRANGSTTGEFDPEKWDERSVGYDLTTIQNYIYSLNAGNVAYDPTASYASGTVGNKIKNLNANDVPYNSTETYADGTVGKALNNLNTALTSDETKILITQNALAKNITSVVATETLKKGDFRFNRTDGRLWRITDTIQTGESIVGGGNAQSLTLGTVFEGFYMGNTIIEFSGGAGWIYDDKIAGTNSAIIVQFRYENGGDTDAISGAKSFILTPQIPQAGRAVVYVRNPDGTTPANMRLYCSYIIYNFT